MRKFILSVASFTAIATSAIAADVLSRKQTITALPPRPVWTGFYVGLNAGGTWSNSNVISVTGIPVYNTPDYSHLFWPGTFRSAAGWTGNLYPTKGLAFLGGGQFGYNQEITENFVAGFEGDIQGTAGDDSSSATLFTSVTTTSYSVNMNRYVDATSYTGMQASKSLDYIGSGRGRIGYKVSPNLLIFGTGGLAYGGAALTFEGQQLSTEQTYSIGPSKTTKSQTLVGWAAGGGIEWMFAPNWSIKGEYLYYDLGTMKSTAGTNFRFWHHNGPYRIPGLENGELARAIQINLKGQFNGSIARVGVNYHFNSEPAPAVAKF